MFPIRSSEIRNIAALSDLFLATYGFDCGYTDWGLNMFFMFIADFDEDVEVFEEDFFEWFHEFDDFNEMVDFYGEEPLYESVGTYDMYNGGNVVDGDTLMPFETFRWYRNTGNDPCFAVKCPYHSRTTAFTPLR